MFKKLNGTNSNSLLMFEEKVKIEANLHHYISQSHMTQSFSRIYKLPGERCLLMESKENNLYIYDTVQKDSWTLPLSDLLPSGSALKSLITVDSTIIYSYQIGEEYKVFNYNLTTHTQSSELILPQSLNRNYQILLTTDKNIFVIFDEDLALLHYCLLDEFKYGSSTKLKSEYFKNIISLTPTLYLRSYSAPLHARNAFENHLPAIMLRGIHPEHIELFETKAAKEVILSRGKTHPWFSKEGLIYSSPHQVIISTHNSHGHNAYIKVWKIKNKKITEIDSCKLPDMRLGKVILLPDNQTVIGTLRAWSEFSYKKIYCYNLKTKKNVIFSLGMPVQDILCSDEGQICFVGGKGVSTLPYEVLFKNYLQTIQACLDKEFKIPGVLDLALIYSSSNPSALYCLNKRPPSLSNPLETESSPSPTEVKSKKP